MRAAAAGGRTINEVVSGEKLETKTTKTYLWRNLFIEKISQKFIKVSADEPTTLKSLSLNLFLVNFN